MRLFRYSDPDTTEVLTLAWSGGCVWYDNDTSLGIESTLGFSGTTATLQINYTNNPWGSGPCTLYYSGTFTHPCAGVVTFTKFSDGCGGGGPATIGVQGVES